MKSASIDEKARRFRFSCQRQPLKPTLGSNEPVAHGFRSVTAPETAPETARETAPETARETAPETAPETNVAQRVACPGGSDHLPHLRPAWALVGACILLLGLSTVIQAQDAGAPVDREVIFWQSIQSSDDPALFDAYLTQFPDGTFAKIARISIEKAEAALEETPAEPLPHDESPDLEAQDKEYVVAINANVRELPKFRSTKVAFLPRGARVMSVGKVPRQNWYLIAHKGTNLGYVYGHFLAEPSEVAIVVPGPPHPPEPPPDPGGTTDLEPGRIFRDCEDDCPELVVIRAGRFLMGSTTDENESDRDERPKHEVAIGKKYAIGRYEVTFKEWQACVDASACSHVPDDEGWGRGERRDNRPVINVSWNDVQEYLRWLRGRTGNAYRLPTEAEWEFAARAGTTTARYWGPDPNMACLYGNVHDDTSKTENEFYWTQHECDDRYAKTAPVGRFEPNAFGLSDMLGNVWEWVEDCWNAGYDGAPVDGSAWTARRCSGRVLRGGSWGSVPWSVRSADRVGLAPDIRLNYLGFRIAREVDS